MASDGVRLIAEFSPSGDYLACSDSSGALQIWETSTGIKRQQYIPSSHLSATCSCIAWAPKRSSQPSVSWYTFWPFSQPKEPTPSVAFVDHNLLYNICWVLYEFWQLHAKETPKTCKIEHEFPQYRPRQNKRKVVSDVYSFHRRQFRISVLWL